VTSYMREGRNLYKNIDVLLIQDGGCAPGYNSVTGFICEYLEKAGREVFICAEGFKSLMTDRPQDYRRLIYHRSLYRTLEHIPGVVFAPPLRESRGADFRTERFPDFKFKSKVNKAVKSILNRHVKIVVGIGGNGTFAGTNALSKQLPSTIQVFFIPVTIDSDIYGTDCIGEFTGVEIGSEKIRCYMADSRTHKRIYIIEMMGAHGGYHALHSCLGAGAHLAILPSSRHDLKSIAAALSERENAVIVVAEGYKRNERQKKKYTGNAATFFRDELIRAGLKTNKRVVCEPFSRDIRGAEPNNLDIMLAQRMARKLTELIHNNLTRRMPAVQSDREYHISFDDIRTDNSVESGLASLANRLKEKPF
jgi:6-phosphofructokinase